MEYFITNVNLTKVISWYSKIHVIYSEKIPNSVKEYI